VLQVNGISLHVEDQGSGRPVLLLHGWPDSSYLWRNQVPFLVANGFHTITPDLRGFGHSDRPERVTAYLLENAVADAVGILDAFDGGFIHAKDQKSRGEGWFEVIAGKSMPEEDAAKCFAYVQTYDTKPKRRLFELMKSRRFWKRSQPRISNWSVIQLKAPTPIGSLIATIFSSDRRTWRSLASTASASSRICGHELPSTTEDTKPCRLSARAGKSRRWSKHQRKCL
jgi:hypothetical protein